jgi:hypothetical protein
MIERVIKLLTEKELNTFTVEERKIIKMFCLRYAKGESKKVLIELKKVIEIWEEENGRN